MKVICLATGQWYDLDKQEDAANWLRHCGKKPPWAACEYPDLHYNLTKPVELKPADD